MDDTIAWKQFMQVIHDEVSLGAGEALQIVYPFSQWNWGGESPVEGSYAYEQWSALNVVPADPGSNANAQAAASRFDTAYRSWFNSLALGDLSKDAHYQSLQEALTESQKQWTTHIDQSQNVYKEQTNGGADESYDDWLNKPENLPTKLNLKNLQDDWQAKQDELQKYRQRIASPVDSIVSAFNDDKFTGYVTEPDSGASLQVRLWDTNPTTPWGYVYELTGEEFKGDAKAGTTGSVTFGKSDQQYDFNKVYGGAATSIGVPFFGGVGAKSFEKVDWSKFGDDYSIEVSWQDLKTVSISPGGWYAGSNITSYGRGDHYATGFSGFRNGAGDYFFGPGGALSRVYSSMIVAYRPTVSVSAGQNFSSYLYEKWQSEGGVSIGPFFFGKESTHIHKAASAKVSNDAFTASSNDDWPLILGYVSKWTLAPQS